MAHEKKDSSAGIHVGETIHPSEEIKSQANIKEYEELYKYSIENREDFWAKEAEHLEWFSKWDKVLDASNPPFYKWFTGGKINIVHNAIDRHLKSFRKNKLALIWEWGNQVMCVPILTTLLTERFPGLPV